MDVQMKRNSKLAGVMGTFRDLSCPPAIDWPFSLCGSQLRTSAKAQQGSLPGRPPVLSYANGKVGMFGASYVGATQMLAAIAHPPHLAGICPVVTASNYHRNWTYQGGAFEQWFNESWTSVLAQER